MTIKISSPNVFISYAWESDEFKEWVLSFSTTLRNNGINVTLDQWEVVPGDRMQYFMEMAVRQNNYVLIICSEKYKQKSENRLGGVGYEGDIMTAEVIQDGNHRKFIPLIRSGEMKTAIPSWLGGKFFLDFTDDKNFDSNFDELMQTLLGIRRSAPPLGKIPEKYRLEMEKLEGKMENKPEESVALPAEIVIPQATSSGVAGPRPRLEADLVWHSGSRSPRGYSDKNPTGFDEDGNLITVIGPGSKPIIHWELNWRFELVLHNNSSHPLFNVEIKSVGVINFQSLESLPKVNNISPLSNVSLKASFGQMVESNHMVADKIMAFKVPEQLEGLNLEISYSNENGKRFVTLMKVENNQLINLLS
ncbi:toll/interleukin-1 receptor domain-containing protein [Pedobacter sp. MC2016-15]|uniref:toll/interleukin-1 receptor domain-containing protein n=1 Tax=Pedobacter sp. MC2016-15 TaxID=2994473 RepID=UPI0022461A02|nr:toll/interleukin-1 receptor domain-containing protein [Pedobacter sp. MC2016-15]MCX2481850.1 toll/interleukin-1 receptor domain-containing protein [Pedobacter sp. MC2016-15]